MSTPAEPTRATAGAASPSSRTAAGGHPTGNQQSVASLTARVSHDLTLLVHQEIELAKLELGSAARTGGLGAGLFGAAAFFGVIAWLLVAVGLAFVVQVGGLPLWAGFLIVAGGHLLLAGLLALLGVGRFKRLKGPRRTVASVSADVAAVRGASARSEGTAVTLHSS